MSVGATDPLDDARRLLGRRPKTTAGCCVWCETRLPARADRDEVGWTPERRYCSTRCREAAAGAKRRAAGAGAEVVLIALAVAGVDQVVDDDGTLAVHSGLPADLVKTARRCRREAGAVVSAARAWAALHDLGASSPGPWVGCSVCGVPVLAGRGVGGRVDRSRLGRLCSLTWACAGRLVVVTDGLSRNLPGECSAQLVRVQGCLL